jgi:hypothetical protein
MHNGVDSIAMCVRVIAELAMEVVSHADLRGAHAVPLPNVFAAVPDGTNARAPTAIENRTGGSSLARRALQTPVKRETKLASKPVVVLQDVADVSKAAAVNDASGHKRTLAASILPLKALSIYR